MPRIDVKTIGSAEYAYFNNCINYVAKADHCIKGYIGATNWYLSPYREEHVPLLMKHIENIRNFYGKHDTRLGIHVVVTFSPEEQAYLSRKSVLEIGYYLAQSEFTNCMTYFAVHDNTELIHIDMLIIPIDVYTGKMYACGKAGWNCIELKLKAFLQNYIPKSMIGSFQVAY